MKTSIANIIKKRNAQWEKATNMQRRVMVARDALERIESGQYQPEFMVYERFISGQFRNKNGEKSLQVVLVDSTAKCECCAVGSLFLSKISFTNEASVSDVACNSISSSNYNVYRNGIAGWRDGGLCKLFSHQVLRKIEKIFEGMLPVKQLIGKNAEERLIYILNNLIKNKGRFRSPKVITS